ncbi:Hpt domain-containing protein [Pedobacter changchengzhani]|uniref:Hpt domain-containing protein n=1 Tax=Pedobacter changchengzhani TaxID=2529274 RepID=A0A4R5MMN4_9SPHI|nr:Hpt domain-containing protein [Pedobacter changchengzhani]TDG37010.1 Hpt domain-containing protein [Pedobacter changchengzhani]
MQNNYDNQPLDLSYLSEMVGHDPTFMIEVFNTFIDQTPFYMADLESALLREDLEKVGNCAHKIKPTLIYVGRADVKEIVEKIEFGARNGDSIEEIKSLVELFKHALERIYVQLEETKLLLLAKS